MPLTPCRRPYGQKGIHTGPTNRGIMSSCVCVCVLHYITWHSFRWRLCPKRLTLSAWKDITPKLQESCEYIKMCLIWRLAAKDSWSSSHDSVAVWLLVWIVKSQCGHKICTRIRRHQWIPVVGQVNWTTGVNAPSASPSFQLLPSSAHGSLLTKNKISLLHFFQHMLCGHKGAPVNANTLP